MMRKFILTAVAFCVAAVALAGVPVSQVAAQADQPAKLVGNLRIGDEAGEPVGVVPDAGPGEKVFRLTSGLDGFTAWLDYDGGAVTPVSVRVMAPQGVILDQQMRDLQQAGPERFDFGFDPPLNDDEYVVNVYVGEQGYLADSLQLLVGDAEIIPPDIESAPEVRIDPNAAGAPGSESAAPVAPPPAGMEASPVQPVAADGTAATPLGPSPLLLVLAALGVLGLLGVVVWAGVSALGSR
jgi:hypothetical protein